MYSAISLRTRRNVLFRSAGQDAELQSAFKHAEKCIRTYFVRVGHVKFILHCRMQIYKLIVLTREVHEHCVHQDCATVRVRKQSE